MARKVKPLKTPREHLMESDDYKTVIETVTASSYAKNPDDWETFCDSTATFMDETDVVAFVIEQSANLQSAIWTLQMMMYAYKAGENEVRERIESML